VFIALYVTMCLNLAVSGSCVTERVIDSNQANVTMGGCLGVEGMESAKDFWLQHPLYHTWKFKGWSCQFGNKPAPDKGKA
jgi:hypothetical protein